MKKKKTNGPKPFVPLHLWVAEYNQVWTCDPRTADSTSRRATVRAFTVALTPREAIFTLRLGLLGYDDIEDPGDHTSLHKLGLKPEDVPAKVAELIEQGYRYAIPGHRMSTSLVALILYLMVVDRQ